MIVGNKQLTFDTAGNHVYVHGYPELEGRKGILVGEGMAVCWLITRYRLPKQVLFAWRLFIRLLIRIFEINLLDTLTR
jgi:hypothetical protein